MQEDRFPYFRALWIIRQGYGFPHQEIPHREKRVRRKGSLALLGAFFASPRKKSEKATQFAGSMG